MCTCTSHTYITSFHALLSGTHICTDQHLNTKDITNTLMVTQTCPHCYDDHHKKIIMQELVIISIVYYSHSKPKTPDDLSLNEFFGILVSYNTTVQLFTHTHTIDVPNTYYCNNWHTHTHTHKNHLRVLYADTHTCG